jgi:hypothetical protein
MSVPPFTTAKMAPHENLDLLTAIGAAVLCDRIEEAWAKAGHRVRAWPEPQHTLRGDGFYVVRTDLIRGMPQGGGND